MSKVTMPRESAKISVIKPIETKVSREQCFDLAKGLKKKRETIGALHAEFDAMKKDFKAQMADLECDFYKDVEIINTGVRRIEDAPCELHWCVPEMKVKLMLDGKVLEERDPTLDDQNLFNTNLFPDLEPPIDESIPKLKIKGGKGKGKAKSDAEIEAEIAMTLGETHAEGE